MTSLQLPAPRAHNPGLAFPAFDPVKESILRLKAGEVNDPVYVTHVQVRLWWETYYDRATVELQTPRVIGPWVHISFGYHTVDIKPRLTERVDDPVTDVPDARDVDEERILNALSRQEFDFRTVEGLSAETGYEPVDIQKVLDRHSDIVRVSLVPDKYGRKLFTTKTKPSLRERLARLRLFVAN